MADRFEELKKSISGFAREERERRNFDPLLVKEPELVPVDDASGQLLKRIEDLEAKLSVLSEVVVLKQELPEMSVDGKTINPLYCMLRTSDTSLALTTKPVNSKGHSFGTVQAAVDDLDSNGFVYVPPGTYNEAVTISGDYVTLYGAGWSTIINGGVIGHAVNVTGDYCVVRDLQVKTTVGGGNAYNGVYCTGAWMILRNVFVNGSDNLGVHVNGGAGGISLTDCYIYDCDSVSVELNAGAYSRIQSCVIVQSGSVAIQIVQEVNVSNTFIYNVATNFGISIAAAGDNSVVTGCTIDTTADDGILIDTNAENCVVVGNRITNWTNEAVDDNSGTSTVANNDTT